MDSSKRIKNYITDTNNMSYGLTIVTREEWEAKPPKVSENESNILNGFWCI